MLKLIGWLGSTAGLIGSLLLALNNSYSGCGFVELLAKISEECGLNKTKVESVLKSLASTAKAEVVANGEFIVQDICKIKTSIRPAGERRNPRTEEKFHSPEKRVVKVTAAKVLRVEHVA